MNPLFSHINNCKRHLSSFIVTELLTIFLTEALFFRSLLQMIVSLNYNADSHFTYVPSDQKFW